MIVLSHKPGEWLEPCLESVLDQADEVILVDNGSAQRTASRVGEARGAHVIRSERNLGYAAGVNLGVRHSHGELVALLNDDAVAGATWLQAAGSVLQDDEVACVVPKVIRHGWYREVILDDVHDAPGDHRELGRKLVSVQSNGTEMLEGLLGPGIHALEGDKAGRANWRWTAPRRPFYVPVGGTSDAEVLLNGDPAPPGPVCRLLNKAGGYLLADGVLGDVGDESPDDGRWDMPSEPFFGSGTALVTRRETFERVGPFAEPFFAYYEDADWCWQARLAGMRVVYDPNGIVEHRHSATSGGTNPFVSRLATRNRALTLVRNAPARTAVDGLRRAFRDSASSTAKLDLLSKAAWATASRGRLSRRWSLTPQEVWDRWVNVGANWDRGPARSANP